MKIIKALAFCIVIIFLALVAVSLLDIFIAVFYGRFYSTAAFVVTFGVGGVFASFICYLSGMDIMKERTELMKWAFIIFLLGLGALIFFFISEIEGGEYKNPFKAFGLMLALTTLIFIKWKPSDP